MIEAEKLPYICILVHPERWCDGFIEHNLSTSKDIASNYMKYLYKSVHCSTK